ncbi:unnamed protein product [Withania somnifera]
MLFIGVNPAISIRVYNELGLGCPRATKYSVYITVFQSLLIGILCMIFVVAVRNHLAILSTNSKDLQRAVADLAWLLGITMLLNSVQPVISGLVAYINLGSGYVFGIPPGHTLGYVANLGFMVEQSAERLRKWGGQVVEAEKTLISEPKKDLP